MTSTTENRTIAEFLKTAIPKNGVWRVSSEEAYEGDGFSYRYYNEDEAKRAFLEYRDDEGIEDVVCTDEDYNEVHGEW
jgi:hypothetical protein